MALYSLTLRPGCDNRRGSIDLRGSIQMPVFVDEQIGIDALWRVRRLVYAIGETLMDFDAYA